MRRPIDPADVARACVFLAGTPSVTGTTLCVDNGQHLVPLPRDIMFVVDELLKAPQAMTTPPIDPLLLTCRRVFLRDYEVWINIGVHEFEKRAEQRVIINVDLYVPLDVSTPKADELDEVVDYDFIRRTVATRLSKGHIHLQETLCDDILDAGAGASQGAGGAGVDRQARCVPRLRGGRRRSFQEQVNERRMDRRSARRPPTTA